MKKNITWYDVLHMEKEKKYFQDLMNIIQKKRLHTIIYPENKKIFRAFSLTPFHTVKIVILGQDPYHGYNQADGLAFSVRNSAKVPPSLQNIFKEIKSNFVNYHIPKSGNLDYWAKQGVLLMNTILTVEQGKPNSHLYLGWIIFTNQVISVINRYLTGVIFLLWGKNAQNKEKLINLKEHYVLKAAHPSPFSAYSGFFGCQHFLLANKILMSQGKKPICW